MRAACFLVLLACLAPGVVEAHAEATPKVDARVELIKIVQSLTGDPRIARLSPYDSVYREEVAAHFAPYADHAAVAQLRTMWPNGFGYDAPVAYILHLGPPPALATVAPWPDDLLARAGSREEAEAFAEALRDFVRVSSFEDFIAEQRPFFEDLEQRLAASMDHFDAKAMAEFYGAADAGVHVIASPLLHHGGYGVPVVHPENARLDAHVVIGPVGSEKIPVFGEGPELHALLWHELSHSFVNPVTSRHPQRVAGLEPLFEPVADAMTLQAYPSVEICLNEHLVRAAAIHFANEAYGGLVASLMRADDQQRGFAYIDLAVEVLGEYDRKRDEHVDFAAFYPRILDRFAKTAPAPIEVIHTIPGDGRTDVDPGARELRLFFAEPMDPRNFAWMKSDRGAFPEVTGRPIWANERECVLPVRLEPNVRYWIGVNTGGSRGKFQTSDGRGLRPFVLDFQTGPAAE